MKRCKEKKLYSKILCYWSPLINFYYATMSFAHEKKIFFGKLSGFSDTGERD